MSSVTEPEHTPGSPEAIAQGCTCDPVANNGGLGSARSSGRFVFMPDNDCPLRELATIAQLLHDRARRCPWSCAMSARASGTWGEHDSDGVSGERVMGRDFHARPGVPADQPWMWTITGAVVAPAVASHIAADESLADQYRAYDCALKDEQTGGPEVG